MMRGAALTHIIFRVHFKPTNVGVCAENIAVMFRLETHTRSGRKCGLDPLSDACVQRRRMQKDFILKNIKHLLTSLYVILFNIMPATSAGIMIFS
jgi:hypothetical protein